MAETKKKKKAKRERKERRFTPEQTYSSGAAVGVGMMGATEASPLGLGVLPLKVLLTSKTRSMTFSDCVSWRGGLDVMGYAPGAANIATLAAGNPALSIAVFFITAITRSNYAYDTAMYECAAYALQSRS